MKRIKSFKMYERLGVPEGNVELAISLYDYILDEFKKTPNKALFTGNFDPDRGDPLSEVTLILKGNHEISGLLVNEIVVDLKITAVEGASKGDYAKGDFCPSSFNVTAGEEFSPGFVNKREKIENFTMRANFLSEEGKDLT